ncbi:flap endonuclease GEN homolog 1 isoform X2 [Hydra vulgaris]|uniref:Flap endonuclease GEN homolog 1 isoform X2 n=1 Tax=Hydra vulgaris TaxID=6087 RepID=A0ABM4BSF1_HYDVU
MGVNYLWDIINNSKEKTNPESLRGKVITVDLSIWIVEAIKLKQSVTNLHIRNMFFRICYLRKFGVKLIIVTEGKAPDLKQNTMRYRNFCQYGVKLGTTTVGRNRFQALILECCELLDLLGIPYIKATGEAEQMCAFLNSEKISDGCLTNDGDFFLYGGKCIYRDFSADPKYPCVSTYTQEKIKDKIGITRHDMIGIALLCGCDYIKGVSGIGKSLVSKFISEKSFKENLLVRFHRWFEDDFLKESSLKKSEILIARKAIKDKSFPNQKVIDEFLVQKDSLSYGTISWKYPNIKGAQKFLKDKLGWTPEYSLDKVLQLVSCLYLEKLQDQPSNVPIQPISIVKEHIINGISYVKVEWKKDSSICVNVNLDTRTECSDWNNYPDSFFTLENKSSFLKVLPDMVNQFLKAKKDNKLKGKKCRTRKIPQSNETDFIVNLNDNIVLNAQMLELSINQTDQEFICDLPRITTNNDVISIDKTSAKQSNPNTYLYSPDNYCFNSSFKANSTGENDDLDWLITKHIDIFSIKKGDNVFIDLPNDFESIQYMNNVNLGIEFVRNLKFPMKTFDDNDGVNDYSKKNNSIFTENVYTPERVIHFKNDLNKTPVCSNMSTPVFHVNTSMNFSNLGDSLLFYVDETTSNIESDFSNKDNLPSLEGVRQSVQTPLYQNSFSKAYESSFDSPLCLVERLKQKHSKIFF